MYKFTVFLLLVAFFYIAEAQLTFTSSWGGKRAITGTFSCKNDDVLAAIRKIIETEAERLILCQKS